MAVRANLTRRQVIAYRVAAQGLHREASSVGELGVLDLGVQEAMGHPASVIFAARVASAQTARDAVVGLGCELALAWTFRGAPHVHRRADLSRVAAAMFPLSEADAIGRLNETGPSVAAAGIAALDQVAFAVTAMREAVTRPTVKGTVSGEVTKALPAPMQRACRPCGCAHVSDSAMRLAAPLAGLELDPGTSPPVLLRTPRATIVREPDRDAVARVASAYLTYLGPARAVEVAGFFGARRADVPMPTDLVEVAVEGAPALLPEAAFDVVARAPDPDVVRLLGPFDPYLQARDRDLVVPDKSRHKPLWPVLGRPGVVLADGEVVGTWRTRTAGKRTLTITVQTFEPVPASFWSRVQDEADRVGVVRGREDVQVVRV